MVSCPEFGYGCFPNLGFYFYLSQSSNANSLSRLNLFKLAPSIWESLLYSLIDTLCSQHDYLWVPLVPEPISPIDQSSLNVFSMANALVFDLFSKNPLVIGFWPK